MSPVSTGLLIVDEGGVVRYDWDGSKVYEFKAERPLISAGYLDGDMVVADGGLIIGLDSRLESIFEQEVVEACEDGAMLSGGRFVCGSDGTDRAYYTYDAKTGELLATSERETYSGSPMLPVPGRDRFATVSVGVSPSDYFMWEMGDDDAAKLLSDSPYHGDFPCTAEVGFIGNPATHLVTYEGLMLALMGADCSADDSSGCFLKDGNLGTLPGKDATYAAVGNERDGEVFALVDTSTDFFFDGSCAEGCILQRVNLETRDVTFSRVTPRIEFAVDTPAQRYYLVPRPNNDSVWVIASGRSIHVEGYDDSLPYRIYLVETPAE